MVRHRPQPMTPGDEYLAHILDELEGQRGVLAEIRDRLPEPAAKSGDGEPAMDGQPVKVDLREPEPVKPAKATPAKKTARRTRG